MSTLEYIALLGLPLLGVLFLIVRGATAFNISLVVVLGWLLLPVDALKLAPGYPAYDKAVAVDLAAVLGLLLARPESLLALRPRWVDAAMAAWCLAPVASSLSNQLGWYDGFAAAFRQVIVWGVPYVVGRAVLVRREDVVAFGKVLVLGAACYLPLVVFESRMAPQLHLWVYGVKGRVGWETANFWGPLKYKPAVFLQSNLELTPLMGAGLICSLALWRGGVKRLAGMPLAWLVVAAAMAMVLGKSLGGAAVTAAGCGILWLCQRNRLAGALLLAAAVGPVYMATRSLDVWDGKDVVAFLRTNVSPRRAESFGVRLENEDRLVDKALQRPAFGWGGYGRSRVYASWGQDISLTDGMWVIALGQNGLVGLAALYGAMLLPVLGAVWLGGAWLLRREADSGVLLAMGVMVVMHAVDCLFNAMPNPMYMMAAGALGAYVVGREDEAAAGVGVEIVRTHEPGQRLQAR
jgi:hypothetical protein